MNDDVYLDRYSKSFYVIVKARNYEDIHVSMKYGHWSCLSEAANNILDRLWGNAEEEGRLMYLIVIKEDTTDAIGAAELLGNYHADTRFQLWSDEDKPQGTFDVKWVFAKNLSLKALNVKANGEEIKSIQDCQVIENEDGARIMKALSQIKSENNSIFSIFNVLDCKEDQMISTRNITEFEFTSAFSAQIGEKPVTPISTPSKKKTYEIDSTKKVQTNNDLTKQDSSKKVKTNPDQSKKETNKKDYSTKNIPKKTPGKVKISSPQKTGGERKSQKSTREKQTIFSFGKSTTDSNIGEKGVTPGKKQPNKNSTPAKRNKTKVEEEEFVKVEAKTDIKIDQKAINALTPNPERKHKGRAGKDKKQEESSTKKVEVKKIVEKEKEKICLSKEQNISSDAGSKHKETKNSAVSKKSEEAKVLTPPPKPLKDKPETLIKETKKSDSLAKEAIREESLSNDAKKSSKVENDVDPSPIKRTRRGGRKHKKKKQNEEEEEFVKVNTVKPALEKPNPKPKSKVNPRRRQSKKISIQEDEYVKVIDKNN